MDKIEVKVSGWERSRVGFEISPTISYRKPLKPKRPHEINFSKFHQFKQGRFTDSSNSGRFQESLVNDIHRSKTKKEP